MAKKSFKFRCTANLRLRAEPNTNSEIIMIMANNSIQEAVDEKDGWYKVMTHWNGKPYGGWCYSGYCEKVSDTGNDANTNSHNIHTISTHAPKVTIDHSRTLSKDEITSFVWGYFIDEGLSEHVAAAVMGNVEIESGGFNMKALGDRGMSYGLCQWNGGRLNALKVKARQMKMLPSDLEVQLAHLMDELNGTEATFKHRIEVKYGSIAAFKKSTASIDTLTRDFMTTFERPSSNPEINHINRRIKAAHDYYNKYKSE